MAKPAPSKLADAYQTYPTPSAAAVAALRGITSKTNESGGGVLYNKEQNVYAATEPVGQSDGAHFAAAVSVPQGWQLHSTYHTHPVGPRSTQFSDDDINTAQQLKAPSYVLARADDKVRMFDPASSKISKDQSSGDMLAKTRFSNGSVVDETPPAPPAPPAVAAAPTQAAPVANPPATPVPVTGSRITMNDFASKHRAQTTKYRHKIVHIKSGARKRP
jgi:hypothetical protein